MEERLAYTEEHMSDVIDSAQNPINGNKWWLKADNPWQLLSTCFELAEALKLDDPKEFKSNLPIHQDGSCNGLQHYAALGGDIEGAKAVNLVPSDRPGDVYTRVSGRVQKSIDLDVIKGIEEAKLMQKRINRKLVKQTVMTNTYGVTFIGAKAQVTSRLNEARLADSNPLTDDQISKCSKYITGKIFEAMDDLFEGKFIINLRSSRNSNVAQPLSQANFSQRKA